MNLFNKINSKENESTASQTSGKSWAAKLFSGTVVKKVIFVILFIIAALIVWNKVVRPIINWATRPSISKTGRIIEKGNVTTQKGGLTTGSGVIRQGSTTQSKSPAASVDKGLSGVSYEKRRTSASIVDLLDLRGAA